MKRQAVEAAGQWQQLQSKLKEEKMNKSAMAVWVGVVLAASIVGSTGLAWAADGLLDVYVNGTGDVVDVQDQNGALKHGPIQNIPVGGDGLKYMSAQSLNIAKVRNQYDGTIEFCCPAGGGKNRLCLQQTLYHIGLGGEVTGVEDYVDGKWVEAGEDDHVHASSEIVAMKSHTIAVFEDEDGNRHGVVISGAVTSADPAESSDASMWFNPVDLGME